MGNWLCNFKDGLFFFWVRKFEILKPLTGKDMKLYLLWRANMRLLKRKQLIYGGCLLMQQKRSESHCWNAEKFLFFFLSGTFSSASSAFSIITWTDSEKLSSADKFSWKSLIPELESALHQNNSYSYLKHFLLLYLDFFLN